MVGVDKFENALEGHDGVYTSKHTIYATRIIKAWRAKIAYFKETRARRASGTQKSMSIKESQIVQEIKPKPEEEIKEQSIIKSHR